MSCGRSVARRSSVAVDLGANIGMYSHAMVYSVMFDRIVDFEPNPGSTDSLTHSGRGGVSVIHKTLPEGNGTGPMKIPVQWGAPLPGSASLEARIDPDTAAYGLELSEGNLLFPAE